jgi:uncharacterized protein involved in tolerance to divalent cations
MEAVYLTSASTEVASSASVSAKRVLQASATILVSVIVTANAIFKWNGNTPQAETWTGQNAAAEDWTPAAGLSGSWSQAA